MIPWMNKATDDDIAVSSRIRIARNFKDEIFPSRMNKEMGERVFEKTKSILSFAGGLNFSKTADLRPVELHGMVERHIISKELEKSAFGGVGKNDDETTVIMINEEDHLRMQTIMPGFQVEKAYDIMNDLHEPIKNYFAYDEQFGYLTACPTNAGTGLRASTMLHIPGIMMTGQLQNITNTIAKMGMTLRGIYGEGSNAIGNMVQLSNQITLGACEPDIIGGLNSVAVKIIENERNARKLILESKKFNLADKIMRSLGTLKYARRLSSQETVSMLSDINMGVSLGLIGGIENHEIHSLMMDTAPCQLQLTLKKDMLEDERDIARAVLVKEKLQNANEV